MDCNPRIGMNFRMFESSTAIDVVRAKRLDLTGRAAECSDMADGRLYVVEPWCVLSSMRRGGGNTGIAAVRHTPHRCRELARWSADDVMPFVLMSTRYIPQTLGNAIRRLLGYVKGRLLSHGMRQWSCGSGKLQRDDAASQSRQEQNTARRL